MKSRSSTSRTWLLSFGALALVLSWGCTKPPVVAANKAPAPAKSPKQPPRHTVEHLTDLMTSVHLKWLLLIRPEEIVNTKWLAEPLGRILRDERMTAVARRTGIDLRTAPSIALASYGDDVTAFAIRHRQDPLTIERKFRERLTQNATRRVDDTDLVHTSGILGKRQMAFAGIGKNVVLYQYGGDLARGPARIATLYAQKKLKNIPRALEEPAIKLTKSQLTQAPLTLILPGPFEGQLARGARGLFGAALAVGVSLRPIQDKGLLLDAVLLGDYTSKDNPDVAAQLLLRAWDDLKTSDLGNLLGLPAARAVTQREAGVLRLRARLDALSFIDGLAAATIDDVAQIMK